MAGSDVYRDEQALKLIKRVLQIEEDDEWNEIPHQIKDLIDQLQAMVRDMGTDARFCSEEAVALALFMWKVSDKEKIQEFINWRYWEC